MKIVIDLDVTSEEFKKIQVFNIKMMNNKITHKVYEAVQKGIVLPKEYGRLRPKGEWSDESNDSLLCSACGKRVYKPFIGGFPTERTLHYYPNFCAFCGADMRKEEKKNDG